MATYIPGSSGLHQTYTAPYVTSGSGVHTYTTPVVTSGSGVHHHYATGVPTTYTTAVPATYTTAVPATTAYTTSVPYTTTLGGSHYGTTSHLVAPATTYVSAPTTHHHVSAPVTTHSHVGHTRAVAEEIPVESRI